MIWQNPAPMDVTELLVRDRFAAALGARLVEAGPDRVVLELEVAEHHRDTGGAVATGALFSLADCAMSLISNAAGPAVAVAAHFTRRQESGRARMLQATVRPLLPAADREVTWQAIVTADGAEVASFTGTTLRVEHR